MKSRRVAQVSFLQELGAPCHDFETWGDGAAPLPSRANCDLDKLGLLLRWPTTRSSLGWDLSSVSDSALHQLRGRRPYAPAALPYSRPYRNDRSSGSAPGPRAQTRAESRRASASRILRLASQKWAVGVALMAPSYCCPSDWERRSRSISSGATWSSHRCRPTV
jgi:hypothetical protein